MEWPESRFVRYVLRTESFLKPSNPLFQRGDFILHDIPQLLANPHGRICRDSLLLVCKLHFAEPQQAVARLDECSLVTIEE